MKVAIVEDNIVHSDRLKSFLQKFTEEEDADFRIYEYKDGLSFLDTYRFSYDIVFLDIQMPGIDGIEVARRLRKIDSNTLIIFITELSQFAINGYEVSAFDYILKPVEYGKFKSKLKRAVQSLKVSDYGTVCVRNKTEVRVLNIADIQFIESYKHRIIYHTLNDSVETAGSLDAALEKLPRERFFKCSASYLVNLQHVLSVKGYDVYLANATLPLSRLRKKEFLEAFVNFTMN